MSRPSVRIDVGEPGPGVWEDQAGDSQGTAFVRERAREVAYDDFESITVSTTAVGFDANKANAHTHAFVTVENAAVRYRVDGLAPTAAVGHQLLVNDIMEFADSGRLRFVRFIRRDGLDATLRVSYGNRVSP